MPSSNIQVSVRVTDKKLFAITHVPSGQIIAKGPLAWGVTPFEGNYYIRRKYIKTDGFKVNYLPAISGSYF